MALRKTAPPVDGVWRATLAGRAFAARGRVRGGPRWRPPEAACTFSASAQALSFLRQARGFVSGVKCRVFAIVHPRFFSRGKGLSLPAEPVSSNLLPCQGTHRAGPAGETGDCTRLPARLPAQAGKGLGGGMRREEPGSLKRLPLHG